MAWNTTFSQTTDWSAVSHLEMFWKAFNERRAVLGQSALYVPAVGCDCQYMGTDNPASTTDKFSVAVIQNWIESYCTSFVQSHDLDGTPRASNYYDGRTTIDMWTWDNLKTAAGLDSSGWLAKTPLGSDYRTCTEGDYFGHWLWNEIRNCLNMLIWTKIGTSSISYQSSEGMEVSNSNADWATCVSNVATAWGAASWSGALGDYPRVYAFASYNGANYTITVRRQRTKIRTSTIPASAGLKCDVDSYCYTQKQYAGDTVDEYDDGGNGWTEDKWNLVDTQSAVTTTTSDTALINDSTVEPTLPPQPAVNEQNYRGSYATDRNTILRWDITGGFVYKA